LKLLKIEIENFRNLKSQQVEFPNQISVLTGKNGQGKPSLLESIYILSHSMIVFLEQLSKVMKEKKN
jgi:recombinational DNA repair ATPase RecF